MKTLADMHGLDHGFFQFPKTTLVNKLGYALALVAFLVAGVLYSTSLSIPDVPRVDEAKFLTELPADVDDLTFVDVQDGYDSGEYAAQAAFIVVPLELEQGGLAVDWCEWVEDDDNGGHWQYSIDFYDANRLTLRDQTGQTINAAYSYERSLAPEGDIVEPPCDSSWSRDIMGHGPNGDNIILSVFLLVEQDPVRYQVLSVAENDGFQNDRVPPEVTQREDRGRWALLATGIGGLFLMYSTTPSLKEDLRRIRNQKPGLVKDIASGPGVLGSQGRFFPHFGPNFQPKESTDYPARAVEDDWLFDVPPLPESYEAPFAQEGDGTLVAEHPNRLGTPKPATVTPYSMGAVVFSLSFIWLSADLRARDGSDVHTTLGWGMTLGVTAVNLIWFYVAWKQFKLVRLINDLPTSPVRSVAVGQAELVGQVRPSVAGTPTMKVGGRSHNGLVAWKWDSYEYVCTSDGDGGKSCSWKHRETKSGGVPFILHDGSGGILVDPEVWSGSKAKLDYGPEVAGWKRGDWRWEVSGFGVGDPVYILGDCVPRTEEDKQMWGCDPTLGNALLTVVPSTDTGDASVMHYGTELDVMSNNRSIFEILIVPSLVFIFGVFMFLNYTP